MYHRELSLAYASGSDGGEMCNFKTPELAPWDPHTQAVRAIHCVVRYSSSSQCTLMSFHGLISLGPHGM